MLAYSSSGVQFTKAGKAWREEQEVGWSQSIHTQKVRGKHEVGAGDNTSRLSLSGLLPLLCLYLLRASTFPKQLVIKGSNI